MLAVCRDLSTNRYPHSDNTMDAESVLKCAEQAAGAAGAMHMCERLRHVSLGLGGRPANAEEVARAANTARTCELLQHAPLGLGGRPANAEEAARAAGTLRVRGCLHEHMCTRQVRKAPSKKCHLQSDSNMGGGLG